MSEELKKQAREFLRQSFDARWKRADPESGLSREEQQITTMAEFAAQVCEQREKEDAVADAEIQEIVGKYQADATRYEALFNNEALLNKEHLQRAEAAELALQTSQREFSQCNLRLDVEYQRAEGLKAALQAKEQEMAELRARISELEAICPTRT